MNAGVYGLSKANITVVTPVRPIASVSSLMGLDVAWLSESMVAIFAKIGRSLVSSRKN